MFVLCLMRNLSHVACLNHMKIRNDEIRRSCAIIKFIQIMNFRRAIHFVLTSIALVAFYILHFYDLYKCEIVVEQSNDKINVFVERFLIKWFMLCKIIFWNCTTKFSDLTSWSIKMKKLKNLIKSFSKYLIKYISSTVNHFSIVNK